jgi:hypothetical protein
MEPHVAAPSASEVVVITGEPALQALVERRLTLAEAINTGVLRFEGEPAEVGRVRQLLNTAFSPDSTRPQTASR